MPDPTVVTEQDRVAYWINEVGKALARARVATPAYAMHCGRTHCRCTHTEPCRVGWIALASDDTGRDRAAPCPQCRPALAEQIHAADTRDGMRESLDHHRKVNGKRHPEGGAP